jgi:putative serine protease PepD
MLDAKRTEEPIVTDGSAWRQPAGQGGQMDAGGWPASAPAPPGRPHFQAPPGPPYPPTPAYARAQLGAAPANWSYPHQHQQRNDATLRGPQPPANSWWSDALADPWRDPDAAVVVVKTPPGEPPALEKPTPAGQGRASLGIVLIVSIVTALLAGALGGTLGYVFATGGGGPLGGNQLGGTAPLAQRPPDSIAGVAKRVLPSVVTISMRSGGSTSLGSGFVVSPDGYVITNNHVVANGSGDAVIRFSDGLVTQATVVGSDPESDVSVLKLDKTGLPADEVVPVEFGDSEQVQVGDPVVAIGSPLGLTSTVTYGIVSYVDRPIRTSEGGTARYYAAIQTDAAVNQGNSGGPLFDAAGRVVGINSVIGTLSSDEQAAGNVGLAFAIPINQAKRHAQEIIETGKARRTVIGAEIDNTYRNVAGGARISTIQAGGPAANAGLKAGDVLMAINKKPIDEGWDVIALVRKYAPGSIVSIDYMRGSSRLTASVTLAADAK